MKASILRKAALAITCAAAIAGFAGDGLARDKHHRGKHDDRYVHARGDNDVRIVIGDNDRSVIRDFLRDDFRRDCPPGLAKKNNGCLPPGQAKKFSRGDVLTVRPQSIWHDLADLISPPPAGHRFVRVDRDVLLVSERNNRIIDLVTLD